MKHGYVVGRIGEDGTRKGLIKLSKVVFHNIIKKVGAIFIDTPPLP